MSDPRPNPLVSLLRMGLFVTLIVLATQFAGRAWDALSRPDAEPRAVTARGALAEEETSNVEVFREASPAVVFVTTIDRRMGFAFNVAEIPRGTGSGFIWDADGHIVTNYHVIRGADAANVTLADQSTWRARVVGASPDHDLAILRIDAPRAKLRPIPVGTSDDLEVGQRAIAIGNPFGLDQTMTTGIISAVGREIRSVSGRPIRDVIQTDAAINPGNSGGPLLDSAGRLIGVNTQIASTSGVFSGVGFAVPVETVNRVVPDLISNGKVTRPGLGVMVASDQWARSLGAEGVIVLDVLADTGAAAAGLRPAQRDEAGGVVLGDVIVGVSGETVRTRNDLFRALDRHSPGDEVDVAVLRDAARDTLRVRLTALE